jgi:hypothetical protein
MMSIFIDCETLGIGESSIVPMICISVLNSEMPLAKSLTWAPPTIIRLNVAEQKAAGRTTDADTVEFWRKQDPRIRGLVMDQSKAVSIRDAIEQVHHIVNVDHPRAFVWQRGSKDADWINSVAVSAGLKQPIAYYRVRDVRTAIDVCGLSSKMNGYVDDNLMRESNEPVQKVLDAMTSAFGGKHHPTYDVVLDEAQLRVAGVA